MVIVVVVGRRRRRRRRRRLGRRRRRRNSIMYPSCTFAPGSTLVIDLTRTDWPWQRLVAGAADKVRPALVGPGIAEFLVEVRDGINCPYSRGSHTKKPLPEANLVAVHSDGRRALHHPHAKNDEPVRFQYSNGNPLTAAPNSWRRHDIIRAFRLATRWHCRNRWADLQQNVFQTVVKRFQERFRSEGWHLEDFEWGRGDVQALALSPKEKKGGRVFRRPRGSSFLGVGGGRTVQRLARPRGAPPPRRRRSMCMCVETFHVRSMCTVLHCVYLHCTAKEEQECREEGRKKD